MLSIINGEPNFKVVDSSSFEKDGILYQLSSDIAWLMLKMVDDNKKTGQSIIEYISDNKINELVINES